MPKQKNKEQEFVCNICDKKFKNLAGLQGHLSLAHKKPQTIDEISEGEKADKKKLENIEETIKNKETFSPVEIDKIRNELEPLQQRISLRDDVAEERLKADKEEARQRQRKAKEDEDDVLSWKDVHNKLKADAMSQSKNQDNSTLLQMMQMQNQQFQNQLKMQEQQHEFQMKILERMEDNKKPDLKNEIKDILGIAKELGLSKESSGSVGDIIGQNLNNIVPLLKDYMEMKKSQVAQQGFIPKQNPTQQKDSFVVQQEQGQSEFISPGSPEMSDEQYAKTHDLSEYGYDNPSPFVNMYSTTSPTIK